VHTEKWCPWTSVSRGALCTLQDVLGLPVGDEQVAAQASQSGAQRQHGFEQELCPEGAGLGVAIRGHAELARVKAVERDDLQSKAGSDA